MSISSAPIRASFDLHCHILPAWDDGARNLDSSLRMIERAQNSGIEIIVATPHVGRAFKGVEHPASDIAPGVASLQNELDSRGLNVKILPGAELMMGSIQLSGEIQPSWTVDGAGKYALVESPYRSWPDFGNNLIYDLMLRGVRPIVAHPERYLDVQKDIGKIESAVSQGALLQITASSILGQTGREMQNCCWKLLEAGWAHLVASDAHNSEHPWPGDAVESVVRRVGEERARQIFEDNPRAVLEGRALGAQLPAPSAEKSASRLGRWFGARR